MHWYDWHTVTERLQGRAYALTRGQPYKVILDPHTPTGLCDFTNREIRIKPDIFDDLFRKKGLKGLALDKANFLISRAITGHEALHVVYSDPLVVLSASSCPALKIVLNLLEDARIERIGSETSHVAKTLFRFLNRIAASELQEFTDTALADPQSGLNLLLHWRLGASIPPLEKKAAKTWRKVLALAEKAVRAGSCADVLPLAKKILTVLGLDRQDAGVNGPSGGVDPLTEKMQSEMTGDRGSEPLSSPVAPQPGGEDTTDSADHGGSDKETDGSEQSSPSGRDGDDTDGNSGEGEDGESEPTPSSGNGGGDGDNGESGVTDDDSSKAGNSPDENNPGEAQKEASGGSVESGEKNVDELVHSVNSPKPDKVEEPGEPGDSEDIEELVEKTAQQVSEDLESLLPEDSPHSSTMARARAYRGSKYSSVHASPYIHYLEKSTPIAVEIIRELKGENPRAVSGASEYPGRFRARYFVRDSSKPFSTQRFQGISTPKMALSLVIDRSGSMEVIQDELRMMSMAITMACETLQIPLSIWALEGQVHVKHFEEHGPQVLAKIAGITADTLTRMMPTVRDAEEDLRRRPEALKQMVLIHDGMPSDKSQFIHWRVGLRGISLFCLYIVPDSEYECYRQNPVPFRRNLDELVGPRSYAIAPVSDIARHWCSFVRNRRNSHSTIIH